MTEIYHGEATEFYEFDRFRDFIKTRFPDSNILLSESGAVSPVRRCIGAYIFGYKTLLVGLYDSEGERNNVTVHTLIENQPYTDDLIAIIQSAEMEFSKK
ncbi:hypothetical protein J4438_02030 [Candidatus Woesearchaeota archaeon]|nr:hypothetical protein [Candidatus Woesearchaeota archaeon]